MTTAARKNAPRADPVEAIQKVVAAETQALSTGYFESILKAGPTLEHVARIRLLLSAAVVRIVESAPRGRISSLVFPW
jgi:hypothetical protein